MSQSYDEEALGSIPNEDLGSQKSYVSVIWYFQRGGKGFCNTKENEVYALNFFQTFLEDYRPLTSSRPS